MSLIIEGMSIPKMRENTEHLWMPGWIEVNKKGEAVFCTGTHYDPNTIRSHPVKEVLTSHGRLIDADAYVQSMKDSFCKPCKNKPDHCINCGIDMHIRIIENEPTIIKAEG